MAGDWDPRKCMSCNCNYHAGSYYTTYTYPAEVIQNKPKVVAALRKLEGTHIVFDDGAIVCYDGTTCYEVLPAGKARQAVGSEEKP